MKSPGCILLLLLFYWSSYSQSTLSARVANYEMDIFLDTERKHLDGHTRLLWINPSTDTIRELQFHLYYNAFKNSQSNWQREGKLFMSFVGADWYTNCDWGWTEVSRFVDANGNDLTKSAGYIHPDDDNTHDQTVLRVPLEVPVMPHDSAVFDFWWKARIPKAMIRTGYNKDMYFFAQWFPKLGVYEPAGMRCAKEGAWNCHQYHADGEYYADFGEYLTHLTVPNDMVLAASGNLVDKVPSDATHTTWTYRAADVIDFAWIGSKHFIEVKEQWNEVEISVVMYPEHKVMVPRYMESTKYVLAFMHDHVGEYPFDHITIIDPPAHGTFISGMEYPMFITSVSTVLLPEKFRSTETLVIHEFVHQYFMQVVASNEQEEPWLDEGITNYYEGRIMDEFYGPQTSMIDWCGLRIGNTEFTRNAFFSSGHEKIAPNTNVSWQYPDGSYTNMSYNKVALWMRTLEGLIGTDVMDEVMRTYFEEWKFRHPCGDDFMAVVNKVVSQKLAEEYPDGMNWFFDQVVRGTDICDYSVASITNTLLEEDLGFVEDTITCIPRMRKTGESTKQYDSRVLLYRLGEIVLPVDVLITFEDGTTVLERWENTDRSIEYRFSGEKRLMSAEIDPERKIYFDLNFINNSKTVSLQRTGLNGYFIRYLTSAQHFLETLSLLM